MRTRTPEQIKRGSDLIQALCTLFYPFVEAAARPKIEAEMASGTPALKLDDEAIQQLTDFLRQSARHDGMPAEEADKVIREAERDMRNPRPFTAEEIAQAVAEESQSECGQLVRTWLNAILFVALDGAPITAASIDDAMLPPLAGEVADAFDENCDQMILGRDGVRDVLRQVKATLPPGRPMPAEAIEFLQLEGVTLS